MDQNIDVAQIMAEITCDVEKRYREIEEREHKDIHKAIPRVPDDSANLNGELCQGIKSRNHILAGEMSRIHSMSGIPWKLPSFETKNVLLRRPFRLIARIILKLTRFITAQQNDVNDTTAGSLELLQESVLSMADWSRNIEERLKALTGTANQMAYRWNCQTDTSVCLTDEMYLKFESEYRGSEEEIKKKQNYYMQNVVLKLVPRESAGMIADLGCGRGEWLSLLKENGYSGIGVDLNKEFLESCEQKGIKAVFMDAVSYLKTLPAECVKLLSAFQLIEHLDLGQLLELMQETGRVMRPDGVILFETPNPVNINVGAASFYLDPTHKRPVHPELIKFLAEENGLKDLQIAYWQKDDVERWWAGIWKNDRTNVKDSAMYRAMEATMMQSFWCPADYALIGRK